jgi:uncharacterized membrane protein
MFDFRLLISAIIFVCLDFGYMNLFKDHFNKQVQDVQGSKININYLAALICYIFLIMGLNYFIIKPKRSISDAFLLGLVIYGTYETTNWAIFTKWSIQTVIIDTLWGGTLFALTAFIVRSLSII